MSANTGIVRVAQHKAYEDMHGQRVTITTDLLQAIAKLMATEPQFVNEPRPAITIAWHCTHGQTQWLVTFEVGYGSTTYVVDDETGKYWLAGLGERA